MGRQALLLEVFGTQSLFARHCRQLLEATRMDAQLLGASGAGTTTPGRAARSLAARAMATRLPALAPAGTLRSRPFSSATPHRSVRGIAVARPNDPARLAHLTAWNTRRPYVLVA